MIVRFLDYNHGYRILSFAKDDETVKDLLCNGLEVLSFKDGNARILPDNIELKASEKSAQNLELCDDYDVFEVSDNGSAYRYFSLESEDNAFIMSMKCNSNCIMCPVSEGSRKGGHIANADDLIKIAQHIPISAPHLTLTGGEPFLMGESSFKFFEYLRNKFIYTDFLLLTNGRVFCNPAYASRLHKTLPVNSVIGIPLHGPNSEIHDHITQAPGSFDQTFKGLKNLLDLGFKVEFRIVVSKLNSFCIEDIADLVIREFPKVDTVKFMGLEMLGNAAKNCNEVWITYNQAFSCCEAAIDKLVENGIDVGLYNFPLCSVGKKYWGIYQKSITDYKIQYSDKCKPCGMKDACGGIFGGTIRLAKDDVTPLPEGRRAPTGSTRTQFD